MGLAQLVLAARYTWLPTAPADAGTIRLVPYILVFFVFTAGTITVAYYFYRSTELRFRQGIEAELLTVSELKTDELVRWRRERLWDAALSQNSGITAAVRLLLETPHNVSAQQEILADFQADHPSHIPCLYPQALQADKIRNDYDVVESLSRPPYLDAFSKASFQECNHPGASFWDSQ